MSSICLPRITTIKGAFRPSVSAHPYSTMPITKRNSNLCPTTSHSALRIVFIDLITWRSCLQGFQGDRMDVFQSCYSRGRRRDKPCHSLTAFPGFVSMTLEKISLLYGSQHLPRKNRKWSRRKFKSQISFQSPPTSQSPKSHSTFRKYTKSRQMLAHMEPDFDFPLSLRVLKYKNKPPSLWHS